MPHPSDAQVLARTRHWLERAVIGLNLCPFAKAVHVKNQIHYAVSSAQDWNPLLADLRHELAELQRLTCDVRDTTLLIAPHALADFAEFNGFMAQARRELEVAGLDGVVQLAAFHPAWEFASAPPQDVSHWTNRAPYPTLHLLREDSVARAVLAFPEASRIYEANIYTLRRLGPEGWHAWMGEVPQ